MSRTGISKARRRPGWLPSPNPTSPPADIVTGRNPAQERQNFANWFTYYRKRWLTSIAAITRVLPNFQGVRVGYRTINGNSYTPVLPIKITGETGFNEVIFENLEVDDSYRLDELGKGWQVAMTTLL